MNVITNIYIYYFPNKLDFSMEIHHIQSKFICYVHQIQQVFHLTVKCLLTVSNQ